MKETQKTRRQQIVRFSVVGLLAIIYVGLGYYLQTVLHTGIVYTHFAYIPIVLSGLWWGRKSIITAVVFAGLTFVVRYFFGGESALWADIARAFFFIIVAFCVGVLSEKVIRARKALTASEEKYRLLIEKSLSGIIVHRDYEILFVNPRLCEMLGYQPEELVGVSMWEFVYENDRKKYRDIISKRREAGMSDAHFECRFIRKDGKIIWADAASSATTYERKPAALVNVYDVTDRKEAEEKRQELTELARMQEEQLVHSTRLAELGEMAASIAHEINQPLTGIKNFAKNASYMIETDAGTIEDIKDNLRRITEQVDRASRIITQMRGLTKKSEQQFSPLDVNATVRESIEFLNPQIKLYGIKLALDLSKNLPRVMGDKMRLEQVFLNLLNNARQAMEDVVERKLGVKTYLETGNNSPSVVVEISDTGKGFSSEDVEKLFTPFYSTKKIGDGTGLGLSISLTIIKDHKGEIIAAGTPGVGAKFKVKLPAPQGETT